MSEVDVSTEALRVFEGVIITVIAAFILWAARAWWKGRERDRKLDRIIAAFHGTEADPYSGAEAKPGVLQQIGDLHDLAAQLGEDARARDEVVNDLSRELLTNNGGSTLRDKVDALGRKVDEVDHKVDSLTTYLDNAVQQSAEIFAVAEENRQALAEGRTGDLKPLPYDPNPRPAHGAPGAA